MSKTMKIIDLLNKIANGEELPKKIKYIGEEFILKFDNIHDIYFYETDTGLLLLKTVYNTSFLLDTVEIIEEQEEIDIQNLQENNSSNARADINQENINLLIKAVKQIDKKINDK